GRLARAAPSGSSGTPADRVPRAPAAPLRCTSSSAPITPLLTRPPAVGPSAARPVPVAAPPRIALSAAALSPPEAARAPPAPSSEVVESTGVTWLTGVSVLGSAGRVWPPPGTPSSPVPLRAPGPLGPAAGLAWPPELPVGSPSGADGVG